MSRSLEALAARKQLLVAQSELQRMQLALYAGDLRDALRPAALVGAALARPAAGIAMVDTVARVFGLYRVRRLVRLAGLALMAFRVARAWQARRAGFPPDQ